MGRRRALQARSRPERGKGMRIGAPPKIALPDMWPGITVGWDARCTGCSWAMLDGVYQVKARDSMCLNHGGSLQDALVRAARWHVRGGD